MIDHEDLLPAVGPDLIKALEEQFGKLGIVQDQLKLKRASYIGGTDSGIGPQ
jgi:hypothetical protein